MSEQTSQEPTMEEILASIRRIISEDDAPAAEADAAPAEEAPAAEPEPAPAPVAAAPEPEPAPPPPPEPEPVVEAAADDEVLELTEKIETHGDIDVYSPGPVAASPAPPPPEPEPVVSFTPPPEPAPAPKPAATDGLVGVAAASAAASAFGQLSAAISMPRDGVTLDDVVRDLLRPLLKDWLDQNLPAIVQASVAEEVERIARTRLR